MVFSEYDRPGKSNLSPSRRFLPFAVLVFLIANSFGGGFDASAQTALSTHLITDGRQTALLPGYKLRDGWRWSGRYSSGWTERDFDDSAWQPIDAPFPQKSGILPSEGWMGVGWFRRELLLAGDLQQIHLAFLVSCIGAADVYVDGEPLASLGKVGSRPEEETPILSTDASPHVIPFDPAGRSRFVIAVHHSNHVDRQRPGLDYDHGFDIDIAPFTSITRNLEDLVRHRTVHSVFFTGVAATVSLLHLLLFAFYPAARENLYYALFTFGVALAAILPAQIYVFTTDLQIFTVLDLLWKTTLAALTPLLLRFLYAVFGIQPPSYYRWFLRISAILILLSYRLPLDVYYILVLIGFSETLRITISAIYHRKDGAIIIGAGIGAVVVTSGHVILTELGIVQFFFPFAYLYGFTVMIFAMSLHLARDFTRLQAQLHHRVDEVGNLSNRRIEQERQLAERARRQQEEETRKQLLEADNAHKLNELEEAKRRREILEELERTTQQLQETHDQLIQSEKMAGLGTLVAGIAHEINTPVGAINSMHDTLTRAVDRLKSDLDQLDDSEIQRALDVIDGANSVIATGTSRVTEIVRSLRSFARMDDADTREADLNEGIDSTLPLIQHQLRSGIEIVKHYGIIPPVLCYPSRLNQVFLNILINAAQAIDGEGTITVRTFERDGRVVVEFVDTGEGIDAENLDRVFDPGYTTKGVGVGTGLGLSICYQIVNDHDGDIHIDSQPGEGTTVTVSIPVQMRAT